MFGLAKRQKPELRVVSEPIPIGKSLPIRRDQAAQAEHRSHADTLNGKLQLIISEANGAGQIVNEHTAANVAAVSACVRLFADMVAMLPIKLYKTTDKGSEEVTAHPAARVMSTPGDLHTSFELRSLMETGKGYGGNGYARVYRSASGNPGELEWLKPCDVLSERLKGNRFINYKISGVGGSFTRYDIIHVRWLSQDGICGMSPIRQLRNAIGTSLSQSNAAGNLVRNGTVFPGYLTSPATLTKDQLADARSEWESNYVSGNNKGRMPILWGDWQFKQTNGMSMVDAQFIESRRFELQEIARWYGIPSFMIGDSTASTSWGTGIAEQKLGFLTFSLEPHLKGWEQSLDYTLLTVNEREAGYYFKFNRRALLQAAPAAQAAFLQSMRSIGVYSINDCRSYLDENELDDATIGDDYTRPLNNTGGVSPTQTAAPTADPEP